MSGLRKLDAEAVALAGQELVGNLEQDPGAVARVDLAPAGAAVLEIEQDLDGILDDIRGLTSPQVDDEADAAGVVLVTRVIETLRTGSVKRRHLKFPRVTRNPAWSRGISSNASKRLTVAQGRQAAFGDWGRARCGEPDGLL